MQTSLILASVCHQLEKESRAFLWGSWGNSHKIHVVGWNDVCKPKPKGGLGLRHLQDMNTAFLMKIGWGLLTKDNELWTKVLKAKYGCGIASIPRILKKSSSSNV